MTVTHHAARTPGITASSLSSFPRTLASRLLCVAFCLAVAACGGGGGNSSVTTPDTTGTGTTGTGSPGTDTGGTGAGTGTGGSGTGSTGSSGNGGGTPTVVGGVSATDNTPATGTVEPGQVATGTATDTAGLRLIAGNAGGPGTVDATGSSARFNFPHAITRDAAGNIYVAETSSHTIRKITLTGAVTTIAGSLRNAGYADGSGLAARFSQPQGIASDPAGTLYVADTGNHVIRKISQDGVVTTLAGAPGEAGSADGTGSAARFNFPEGIELDSTGNIYVADTQNRAIRKITPQGAVTTLAGAAGQAGGSTDGTGTAARFILPHGLTVDAAGNIYVADSSFYPPCNFCANDSSLIRKITPAGVVTTLAGTPGKIGSADGTGAAAQFAYPTGISVDGAGNVYVADTVNSTIRRITPAGVVTTLAGTAGQPGGVDGIGAAARFGSPRGVKADAAGNVYVVDAFTVRRISPSAQVVTLAGMPPQTGTVDAQGPDARFTTIKSFAMGANGNLFVTDGTTIRQVTQAGVVSTLSGVQSNAGSPAVDGPRAAARFQYPYGAAVDAAGNLYVADGQAIRKITPAGDVSTFAGSADNSGSVDGTGSAARFSDPRGVAIDAAGNLYVADSGSNTIRKVTQAGVVTTLAGAAGQEGVVDGSSSAARFQTPFAVATDGAGNVYVTDYLGHTVRKITPAGAVTTLAGTPRTPGSADGSGSAARFTYPQGLAVDGSGNVYVADTGSNTIRRITPSGVVTTVAGVPGQTGIQLGALPGSLTGPSAIAFIRPQTLAISSAGSVLELRLP